MLGYGNDTIISNIVGVSLLVFFNGVGDGDGWE